VNRIKADKVMISGDWHGNALWADHVIKQAHDNDVKIILQLGDFGIWPFRNKRPKNMNITKASANLFPFTEVVEFVAAKANVTVVVIPGNHEDYDQINAIPLEDKGDGWGLVQHFSDHIIFLPRGYRFTIETTDGTAETSFIAVGGAPSIDFEYRKLGTSWWLEEALTDDDETRIVSEAIDWPLSDSGHGVDVFLSHDAPEPLAPVIQRIVDNPQGWSHAGLKYSADGRNRITRIFNAVRPKFVFHGHYHVRASADLIGGRAFERPFDFHVESLDMDEKYGNTFFFDIRNQKIIRPN